MPLLVGGEVIGAVLVQQPQPLERSAERTVARVRRAGRAGRWPTCACSRSPRPAPPPTRSPGCPTAAPRSDTLKRMVAQAGRTRVPARRRHARPRPLQADQRHASATAKGDDVLAAVGDALAARSATATSPAASAARSSWCCCPTPTGTARSRWPRRSAPRSPARRRRASTARSPPASASPTYPIDATRRRDAPAPGRPRALRRQGRRAQPRRAHSLKNPAGAWPLRRHNVELGVTARRER